MGIDTLRQIGGHADDDFNWAWYEDNVWQARDIGRRLSPANYDYMTRNEVGTQRLGRMGVGAESTPVAESGDNLPQMAAEESLRRLAQMGLRHY